MFKVRCQNDAPAVSIEQAVSILGLSVDRYTKVPIVLFRMQWVEASGL